MVIAKKIVIPQANGPLEVFFISSHPVNPGQDLKHLAVGFDIVRDNLSIRGIDGGMLPHVIENTDHPVAPGAFAQPFGKGKQSILDVLGRI